jgi:hypothetical protein
MIQIHLLLILFSNPPTEFVGPTSNGRLNTVNPKPYFQIHPLNLWDPHLMVDLIL